MPEVNKAKSQNEQEKIKSKHLENARHKREEKDEAKERQIARAARTKKKKCASLAQKEKWSIEDTANATGRRLETAKRKARRIAEKIELECGK